MNGWFVLPIIWPGKAKGVKSLLPPWEVLQLLAEGFSNREIADKLVISLKTVGVHRLNLLNKLNIDNVTALTKYAIRRGIISLDE